MIDGGHDFFGGGTAKYIIALYNVLAHIGRKQSSVYLMRDHWLYRVVNTSSKEQYIGVSDRPFKRWEEHAEADSRLGRNIREYGIIHFSFQAIAVFSNRQEAERAERRHIEEERPSLNGAHNPEAMPVDFFGNEPAPENKRRHKTLPSIDTGKLGENEHFKILGEEANKIVVLIKSTGEKTKISKKIEVFDMPILAPLDWWRSLLSIAEHQDPTRPHLLRISDSMIRIAQDRIVQSKNIGGAQKAKQIIQDILAAQVRCPSRGVNISVHAALKSGMTFINTFGVRFTSAGSADGLLIAHSLAHQKLLKNTTWKTDDVKVALLGIPEIKPYGKVVRFGKQVRRPLFVPKAILEEMEFPQSQ